MKRIYRKHGDSHANLPLDPDSDQFKVVRPIHTDVRHIGVVGLGAFFGTLARYEIGLLLPEGKNAWPLTTFLINISGAFVLGLLLEMLLAHDKDRGGRRIVRLLLGTGFLGAFTTYSSLATTTVLLSRSGETGMALSYALGSVIMGVTASAFGIYMANTHRSVRGAKA